MNLLKFLGSRMNNLIMCSFKYVSELFNSHEPYLNEIPTSFACTNTAHESPETRVAIETLELTSPKGNDFVMKFSKTKITKTKFVNSLKIFLNVWYIFNFFYFYCLSFLIPISQNSFCFCFITYNYIILSHLLSSF